MTYLADSIEVNLFHPGVKQMRFIIPWGVINKTLKIKELPHSLHPIHKCQRHPFFSKPFLVPCSHNFHAPISKR